MQNLSAAVRCEALRERAAAVHDLVSYSYAEGIGVSEEAITDVMLVELRRRLRPFVLIKKFTKHQESSLSGADWLMTIGRPGRWLSLLVQAKLARPGSSRLAGLHHGKGTQRETLVAYARQENYVPLYVIYTSFAGEAPPRQDTKGKKRKQVAPVWSPPCPAVREDIKQMGCVAVRPRHIALMYRGKSPKDGVVSLLDRGRPWSCLLCCPRSSGRIDLADAIGAGLAGLPMDSPAPTSPGGAKAPVPDDTFASAESFIAATPPAVVTSMLEGGDVVDHAPFAGVMVISSTPIEPSSDKG